MAHGACTHCGCAFEECECVTATGRTVRMASLYGSRWEPYPELTEPTFQIDFGTLELRVLASIELDPGLANQAILNFDYILMELSDEGRRTEARHTETVNWPYVDWL